MKSSLSLVALSFVILTSCIAQRQRKTVQDFVYSIASNNIRISSIIENKIKPDVAEGKRKEADSTITLILQSLRQMIEQVGGFDNIRVVRLDEAQSVTPLNLEVSGYPVEDVFIITNSKNEFLFPILIEKDRVVSFSTFRKGSDKQYFLVW